MNPVPASPTRTLSPYSVPEHGFTMVRGVIDERGRTELVTGLGSSEGPGRRGVLALPCVSAIARSQALLDLVRPYLPCEPLPVRAIYFDKSSDTNWLVPWHQDLTIAVAAKVDLAGFGPWSNKDGIPHVQPPVELLEKMLTVRIHLDDADDSNGALRVLPGSHRLGRLSSDQIQRLRTDRLEHLCSALAGDVLLMRPLLLHSSSRSISDRHRRILHIEYAGFRLPDGLAWHERA